MSEENKKDSKGHIASVGKRFPDLRRWMVFLKNDEFFSILAFDLDLDPDKCISIVRLTNEGIGNLFLMNINMESVYGTMNEAEHQQFILTGDLPSGWAAFPEEPTAVG